MPDPDLGPGVYELLVDEQTSLTAGNDTEELALHITHAGMAPVTRVVEIYRPETTEGYTLGVESDGDLTKVNTLDGHTAQTGDSYALVAALNDPSVGEIAAGLNDPTAAEIVAALKAATGWTAGGTKTFAEAIKILLADAAGKWQDGAGGAYSVLDAEDQNTVVMTVAMAESTPYYSVTLA